MGVVLLCDLNPYCFNLKSSGQWVSVNVILSCLVSLVKKKKELFINCVYLFVCLLLCMCAFMPASLSAHEEVWGLQEPVFSSHYVGPGDQRQVGRSGSRHLYLLSHLAGPRLCVAVISL